ncbi:GntR family transcriptional regulator [Frigidibacter sp. ROC022]|uniref:GntR family transcriptional regulator n=1 Tax=Frigidibacter sp. ROC022 TaxID=2971796 RepID=UPI00215B08DF|nr:GntR family transcriptional regulator [Frigidibacter sp. ROC022]MCR8725163.1 GntR family transcriptional regulator [Frigidibacter sp. ROC022]
MTQESKPQGSTQSSTQRAYLDLRSAIIMGKIPPGERLKVETLKEVLSTGASPVREALSLLTSDQLVERIDQRGFRVAQTNRAQFQEILNLRCELEDMALRQSISTGDRDWEDALVLAHHHMTRTDRSDTTAFEERHKEFHMALLKACNSPILLRFCGQLYDLNVRYRYLAGTSKSYGLRDVAAEHRAILDAAVQRQVDKASELLMEHYRKTGEFLAELIS